MTSDGGHGGGGGGEGGQGGHTAWSQPGIIIIIIVFIILSKIALRPQIIIAHYGEFTDV